MTAEKIHAGVKLALADFAPQGWRAQNCFIKPDETAVPTVERCLADYVYDCVAIGAGLRLPVGWFCLKRWSTPYIVPRHKRPSPSTPVLKTAVPRSFASSSLSHSSTSGFMNPLSTRCASRGDDESSGERGKRAGFTVPKIRHLPA